MKNNQIFVMRYNIRTILKMNSQIKVNKIYVDIVKNNKVYLKKIMLPAAKKVCIQI
jgi:hypothetical protein